jgi:hypothetical protein
MASTGHDYVTRLLVRRPTDAARFSGRVVVEPFNTSAGADLDAAWSVLRPRLVAQGDAWVGVTVRTTSLAPLAKADAARYQGLSLSSNGLEWDILAQVGVLARNGTVPLDGHDVEHVYLTGYSQSAIDVGTFLSAVAPRARQADGASVFDGYLVMGRSGSLTPLESGQALAPAFEHLPLGHSDVPVVELQTETDVLGFSEGYTSPSGAEVRGDDGPRYRLYEIAGSSHAVIPSCAGPPSTFPTASFGRAAYADLVAWVERHRTPPEAEPIETTSIGTVSVAARDGHGNARGGVRSPFVDVPLASYAGNDVPGVFCKLSGVARPFPAATAVELYRTAADYLAAFERSLDATIDAGFLLAGERAALLEDARALAAQAFA